MIGKVSGRLDYRGADHVLIDTGGGSATWCYCSDRTLAAMPAPGEPVALYTDLVVREDLMQLIGFLTLAEREWHRLLDHRAGGGRQGGAGDPRHARGRGGGAGAVARGRGAIRAAPGVGPKIAQRVVLELRAKAPSVIAMGAAGAAPGRRRAVRTRRSAAAAPVAAACRMRRRRAGAADALSALVNLGYGQGEAAAAVAGRREGADAAALIRAALRALAPKG